MLSKSLDVIDHEEWIAELGEAFGSHVPMYNRYPEEKVEYRALDKMLSLPGPSCSKLMMSLVKYRQNFDH